MMETEDEARVSLDEEFDSNHSFDETKGRDNPEAPKDVQAAVRRIRERDRDAKMKGEKRESKWKMKQGPCWYRVLGIRYPMFGGETWETVGTSWILPDAVHTCWRFFQFLMVTALYGYLALERELSFIYYSTDVFLGVLVTSSILLIPNLAVCLAGPYEDELDSSRLRWVWTLIAVVYQTTVTNTVFISISYWGLWKNSPEVSQAGSLSPNSQLLLHSVSLAAMGGELVFGCIEVRASYALLGISLIGLYLGAIVGGHHRHTGKWLYVYLNRKSLSETITAHFAILGVYIASVFVVFLVERGRRALANWIEVKRRSGSEASEWPSSLSPWYF